MMGINKKIYEMRLKSPTDTKKLLFFTDFLRFNFRNQNVKQHIGTSLGTRPINALDKSTDKWY